ncbi:uncharacterized protein LOC112272324 isoform X1 [Brachypodium distachyon]|nr:uncharacterized protein LOC112272324 isoform X1 [Brachypodium distachyon]|eukprot:XP_024318558.1 uncharacterized protein LOC112272324 isoform X1 [Brachypodium distachyon]
MGNKTDRNAHSCASGETLHSFEVITMETSKSSNDENQQVGNEHSVRTLNSDCVANRLPLRVNESNLQNPLDEYESPPSAAADQLNLPKDKVGSPCSLQNIGTHHDVSDNISANFMLEREKKKVRSQSDNKASRDLQNGSMTTSLPQPSTVQTVDRKMPSSENMNVLPKESSCPLSENFQIGSPMGCRVTPVLAEDNQSEASKLLDGADSSSFSETSFKEIIVLEDSDTEDEDGHSIPVDQYATDNRKKQRRLVLLDDDEEQVAEVKSEDFNHRSLECDGSMSKPRIDDDCVDEAVQSGEFNNQNVNNDGEHAVQLDVLTPEAFEITRPVKKRRVYREANLDEEVMVGTGNARNDVSNLTSQTLVAKDHLLQTRMPFDSVAADQQCCMYSQPIDEPIWSGILQINAEEFVWLDAHLSTKACELVWQLSRSLQTVVEVIKLPQFEAWPKSWEASGPTDDNIALYFFPPSMSSKEESDGLVEELIESSSVLKVALGIAELLIFPSTILPDQYKVCQGKHYLWGLFKRTEVESENKDVLVEQQDGSACAKEGETQEHHFAGQQYDVQCEAPGHDTSILKDVVHVENQLLVDHDFEAQEGATEAIMGEGKNSSSAKLNPPKATSNCSTQPRLDPKLHAPEVHSQEDEQDLAKPSGGSGPAAVTPKPTDTAEHGPTQLFGFVAARTPRAQQLIQEMVSEGALLFSVPGEMVNAGSAAGSESPPMHDCCQSIGFVPMDDDVASEACLELFPVRQDHIGRAPTVEASKEVDLDLILSARSRAPSAFL